MVRRQAPVRGFHSFTSPAAADSPTASSLDSANARGPERCPGASMAAAFLGSSSSLMDHACQPAFHCQAPFSTKLHRGSIATRYVGSVMHVGNREETTKA